MVFVDEAVQLDFESFEHNHIIWMNGGVAVIRRLGQLSADLDQHALAHRTTKPLVSFRFQLQLLIQGQET